MKQFDVVARIYATLLDAYRNYLDSDDIWERYWGNSENPPHTPEEFKQQKYEDLINRINRVPFENEATAKGTAFNELVDAMIEKRKPNNMEVSRAYKTYSKAEMAKMLSCKKEEIDEVLATQKNDCRIFYDEARDCYVNNNEHVGYDVVFKTYKFFFPLNIIKHFACSFKNAVTQYKTSGMMYTIYGRVELYGYIDELMPMSVHDIKTTKEYTSFSFRNHYQHLVYPYCLQQEGMDIRRFDYDITDFKNVYSETYYFNDEHDIPRLRAFVEEFLEFLFAHKYEITDKKIFNEE